LKKKSYELIGIVFGANRIDAKLHFVDGFDEEFDEAILNPKIA
jgi:hypothetical protein